MKKVVLVLGLITMALSSCKKEVDANSSTSSSSVISTPCVDCDEIISFSTFNIAGAGSFGNYVSINQCTGVQVNGSWSTSSGYSQPYVGQCWE